MDERDEAQQFEDLLNGRTYPGQYISADAQNAANLAHRMRRGLHRLPHAKQAQMRERLLAAHPAAMRQNRTMHIFQYLSGAVAGFALIAGLLFAFTRLLPGLPGLPARPEMGGGSTQVAMLNGTPTAAGLPAFNQPEQSGPTLATAAAQVDFTLLAPDPAAAPLALERVESRVDTTDTSAVTITQTYAAEDTQVRISQTSLTAANITEPGEAPMKSTGETQVRGRTGYWLTLNTGERALTWVEGASSVAIFASDLPDEQILALAQSLQPVEEPLAAAATAAPAGQPELGPTPTPLNLPGELPATPGPTPTALATATAALPGPTPTPLPAGSVSHAVGASINLAKQLTAAEAVEIRLYYAERSAAGDPYYTVHILNDPAQMTELLAALDADQTVTAAPLCMADLQLRFWLPGGRSVSFGYLCDPANPGLNQGRSSDGLLVVDGQVSVSPEFVSQLAPALEIAELRRPNNTAPRWTSRVASSRQALGDFVLDEFLLLDPGDFAPSQFEWKEITPDWVYEKNAALRSFAPAANNGFNYFVNVDGHNITATLEPVDISGKSAVVVRSDGQEVYRTITRMPAGSSPLKGLWAYKTFWVLEVDGSIVVNGSELNDALDAQETFGWQMLGGENFLFVLKDGQVSAMYGQKLIPLGYSAVMHNACCEAGAFNPAGNANMVWFYAMKDGRWRYVELMLASMVK